MELVIILLALGMLMFIAYRGFSVIIFAPICALFAVLLTEPGWILPFYSNVFMGKMVEYIQLYFPIFLLGAIFGKVVEMSGLAKSIASTIVQVVGQKRGMLAIVLLAAILTYSGISLVVVAFAVYPFAAHLIQTIKYSKTFNSRYDCTWFIHLYNGCIAWFTTSTKRNSNKLLWNRSICCTYAWDYRSDFYLRTWNVVFKLSSYKSRKSRRRL